jgi:hypothetical protein
MATVRVWTPVARQQSRCRYTLGCVPSVDVDECVGDKRACFDHNVRIGNNLFALGAAIVEIEIGKSK